MSIHESGIAGGAKIGAVLFDYGLVLTGPADPAAWQLMKNILGADEEAFHAAYWRSRHDYDRGTLNAVRYWQAVARDLGQELPEQRLGGLLGADIALWTQPNQPMIDWAAALQRAGMRTGILSNLGDSMETGVMQSFRWMGDFAHHTFSHRLGIAKPELAIYRHAAEGLGVPAEAVLFVDDREENIRAAVKAGMQAIQYREHVQFVREFRERGYASELPTPAET